MNHDFHLENTLGMMDLVAEIRTRLASLDATEITLHDDSASHAGHAGSSGGCHFDLLVVSSRFVGQGKLARHRMVYALLTDLIPQRIHALSIKALTPDEF